MLFICLKLFIFRIKSILLPSSVRFYTISCIPSSLLVFTALLFASWFNHTSFLAIPSKKLRSFFMAFRIALRGGGNTSPLTVQLNSKVTFSGGISLTTVPKLWPLFNPQVTTYPVYYFHFLHIYSYLKLYIC